MSLLKLPPPTRARSHAGRPRANPASWAGVRKAGPHPHESPTQPQLQKAAHKPQRPDGLDYLAVARAAFAEFSHKGGEVDLEARLEVAEHGDQASAAAVAERVYPKIEQWQRRTHGLHFKGRVSHFCCMVVHPFAGMVRALESACTRSLQSRKERGRGWIVPILGRKCHTFPQRSATRTHESNAMAEQLRGDEAMNKLRAFIGSSTGKACISPDACLGIGEPARPTATFILTTRR